MRARLADAALSSLSHARSSIVRTVAAARDTSRPETMLALEALRARRRAARTATVDPFDAFYQAYLTAFLAVIAVLVLSGAVGDAQITGVAARHLVDVGPAWLGLGAAVVTAVGLRSGSRGGPLALEAPDVHHCLLSPVPLGEALRGPALRQLRTMSFGAGAAGAVAAQLAARRLPGNALVWVIAGAAFAVVTVALGVGIAWLAAGHRIGQRAATTLGAGLLAWSGVDVAQRSATSPLTLLGRLPLSAIDLQPLAILPAVGLVVALLAGLRALDGISLEAAQRRSSLVGQLRFAATMRDVRTVMLLRRQLSQETPRARPWVPARGRGGRSSVVLRGYRTLMRTPAARLGRMLTFGLLAAASAAGAWAGTTPLLFVAGLASYLAGLEAIEPLAQEIDHPTVLDLSTADRGRVLSAHLVVPALTMTGVAAVSALSLLLVGAGPEALSIAFATVVPAALAGTAGAAITTVSGAFSRHSESAMVMPPEAAGMGLLYRAAFPPAVAAAGFLPALQAIHARSAGLDPLEAARSGVGPVLVLTGLVVAYVRFRPRLAEAATAAVGDRHAPIGGT